MAVSLVELNQFLTQLLQPHKFNDYCPNGIQVEGKAEINKIVSGVTASQDLIEAAIAAQADAVLVHHGYFWKGENQAIVGMKKKRIARLLEHDISLIAYHLPLDAHPELGNNAQLAKMFGWQTEGGMDSAEFPIGNIGSLAESITAAELAAQLEEKLDYKPLVVGRGVDAIKRIAWCTGAAQSMLEKAVALGVDAFISGEISENTVHSANELGIHYFAAGHHATERGGVIAVGELLAKEFNIEHEFIDMPVPV